MTFGSRRPLRLWGWAGLGCATLTSMGAEAEAGWSGHGVLLVGVPELEGWSRERTAHYDASFVSADPDFAHAHVTVLAPFPVERLDVVRAVAAAVEPFEVTFARLAVFPDGVIHLVPEPGASLRALSAAARTLLPEVEPYWGAVADPAPHLTVDRVSDAVDVASIRALLGDLLPVRTRVDRLLLTWWESGNCRTLASVPLGAGVSRRA